MKKINAVLLFVTGTLAAACGPSAPEQPAPQPAPVERALPPIEPVNGALALDVVYPRENHQLTVSDSTFIFGSTGNGNVQLRINGAPVTVEPNGAFLAYLPVPADGVYRLEGTLGAETATYERRVRVPAAASGARPAGQATIVPGSVSPRGAMTARRGETVGVSFRGTAGGNATLLLPDGTRVPMVEQRGGDDPERVFVVNQPVASGASPISTYRGVLPARTLATRDTAIEAPTLVARWPGESAEGARERAAAAVAAGAMSPTTSAQVQLVVGTDTLRMPVPLNLAVVEEMRPRVGVAADRSPVGGTNDGYVVGRPAPGTTSHWFFPNGTEFSITGERAGNYRVQLSDDQSAWVGIDEVRLLPEGTPAPASLVGSVRLAPSAEWVDARFSLSRRLPMQVETDERSIKLTLYGATSSTDWLFYGSDDPLIDHANWDQPADGIYTFTLDLTQPVWGYQYFWTEGGDLVLRVRRPPRIDPNQPLRGLVIGVDPGHGPPEGRFGPTRYTESAANLAISLRLQQLLEQQGARVVITRTDTSAVGLYDRPLMATRANAHIFVSIHNNALPDGVNPFVNNGTSVYYFHALSADLARKFQQEIVQEFGLRDLGFGRSSLAVVRWPTWFPSALTESMFFMLPDQEAALKNPAVQDRLARAHLRAIERFVMERAGPGSHSGRAEAH